MNGLVTVENLTVEFDGVTALDGVGFELPAGAICGLIGPNGAGKTTLFNCLSRLVAPTSGRVLLDGRDLLAVAPHRIAALGVARTFQHPALLDGLDVRDNVKLGAPEQRGAGPLAALRPHAREIDLGREADRVLAEVGLAGVGDRRPGELPYGTVKRVDLARAIMGRPRLLLLDEPANGLNHAEVEALSDLLLELRERLALTILLVEHHMGMVQRIADHVVVLDFGRVIAEGPPAQACAEPAVVEAYLGVSA